MVLWLLCRLAVVFPVQSEVYLVLFQDHFLQPKAWEQDYYLLSSGTVFSDEVSSYPPYQKGAYI